jgi:hypothetical protein
MHTKMRKNNGVAKRKGLRVFASVQEIVVPVVVLMMDPDNHFVT